MLYIFNDNFFLQITASADYLSDSLKTSVNSFKTMPGPSVHFKAEVNLNQYQVLFCG